MKLLSRLLLLCVFGCGTVLAQSTSAVVNTSSCEKPEYPAMSKRLEEEGTVQLKFLVGTDGKVIESAVEKSSGFLRLDDAARQGLLKCQFKPASVGGIPQQSWASMKYTWRLETKTANSPNQCPPQLRLSAGYGCLYDYRFTSQKDIETNREVGQVAAQSMAYVITAAKDKNCNSISIKSITSSNAGDDSIAKSLSACQKNGCECGILVNNGIVVDQNLFSKYANNTTQVTSNQSESSPINNVPLHRLENEKLREEAALARQRQRELEEQLRQAQQVTPMPTQTASIGAVGRRIALVVGNANYKVRPLKNPRNDADDVSRSLKATGFEVIDLRDATLPQMRTAVRQFGDRLINNDVGLVYYSGHGVEVKGRNYFIPVNADIQREDEIADQGLDVSLILEKMSTAGKGVNILIVDACRDDPFGRSFRSSSRGLAQMDAPRGTIIAYATSPGKVASDGDARERNSPYTKHLVKAMQSPNKPIEQVFKEVRRAVQDETKNQQTPWENTSLSGDFFFRVLR